MVYIGSIVESTQALPEADHVSWTVSIHIQSIYITNTICPVMWAVLSEAQKVTAAAMSSDKAGCQQCLTIEIYLPELAAT